MLGNRKRAVMPNLDERGSQDEHGPSDLEQPTANHGIGQDKRGQKEPTDRNRAQQEQQSPKYSDM
jgi:hypothetical protein